jgi:hypothetical protein
MATSSAMRVRHGFGGPACAVSFLWPAAARKGVPPVDQVVVGVQLCVEV